ncbi:RNA polymerase III transcription factor IIIC subunit-domain-containing protein [Rhodotorula diobovata]|uniref:RNA polymerase III transcription factor IIIC subunit-domain-containing protein n=1 Tax=Rhodotorula diobovata TaxID=5288 RepID=A0A5C5FQ36_9BASI|nr:RNA polymerase III transcription factor IIIC subunit-domain-containing protein [Rhodotorula diobovata]
MDDDLRLPTPPPLVNAPSYPLPPEGTGPRFAALEYPGPVTSVDKALALMGGLARISETLEADPAAATQPKPVELDLDPGNRWMHPVPGSIARGTNIVCRVIKRRRKVPRRDEHGQVIEEGVYTIQPVGLQHQTVRFRAMADFTFTPEPEADADPTMQLADALTNMNGASLSLLSGSVASCGVLIVMSPAVAGIRDFQFPEPREEFPSSACLPPPVFSRTALPQLFDFKPAAGTVQQVLDSGATRLISSTRHKSRPMRTILFVQPEVPSGPEDSLTKELGRTEPRGIELRLRELLEERPVWTRTALINRLTSEERKVAKAEKTCWPMVAYTFGDGPFRDFIIRFGYDPRAHPDARFYQHINLRNTANTRSRAQPGARSAAQAHAGSFRWPGKGAGAEDQAQSTSNLSHVFDGVHTHSKVANFQLIDITDPLVSSLIHSPTGVLPACSPDANEGWYAHDYLDQIRQVLRRKWLGALEGVPVADDECEDLLGVELSAESRVALGREGHRAATAAAAAAAAGAAARARAAGTPSGASGSGAGTGADDDDDAEEEDEQSERAGDSGAESGSGSGSASGSASASGLRAPVRRGSSAPRGRAPADAAKAPWEQPRKKRTRAKAAETEADLLARLSQQARRKSSRVPGQSGTPAPP